MYSPTIAPLSWLLLALFALQVAASVIRDASANGPNLGRRESQISCGDYATLANLTAIGTNSTFRAAFIKASPAGTQSSETTLNDAATKFDNLHLINDTSLNKQCGNLTAVALAAAPSNFSEGVVGPFKISMGIRHGSGIGFMTMVTAAMVGATVLLL